MTLDNNTLLRGFLAHLQSNVRKMAALDFERDHHPDSKRLKAPSKTRTDMQACWEDLSRDLVLVLGPGAALVPFGALAHAGTFAANLTSGEDVFRITFKALKKLADKARRRHPEITLLQSWDIKAREPAHVQL